MKIYQKKTVLNNVILFCILILTNGFVNKESKDYLIGFSNQRECFVWEKVIHLAFVRNYKNKIIKLTFAILKGMWSLVALHYFCLVGYIVLILFTSVGLMLVLGVERVEGRGDTWQQKERSPEVTVKLTLVKLHESNGYKTKSLEFPTLSN